MYNLIDSLNFLKLNGLPVEKFVVIEDEHALKEVKYPSIAKIITSGHKTEKGGVKIVNSYEEARKFLRKHKKIIIQNIAKGIELFLGVKKDPVFGQVILFGLGGIFVEVLNDVSIRVCPITKSEAEEMIKEIKGHKVLQGYRGLKPVNISKLAEIISKLSNIAVKYNIKELDINPMFAEKNKFSIVDARI